MHIYTRFQIISINELVPYAQVLQIPANNAADILDQKYIHKIYDEDEGKYHEIEVDNNTFSVFKAYRNRYRMPGSPEVIEDGVASDKLGHPTYDWSFRCAPRPRCVGFDWSWVV